MKAAALALAALALPTSVAAYADYVCGTTSGSVVFVLDIAGKTITLQGTDPVAFTPAPVTAYRMPNDLTPIHVGQVALPRPSFAANDPVFGFALIQDADNALKLLENFVHHSGDPDSAFRPVQDVIESTQGMPCVAEEAD